MYQWLFHATHYELVGGLTDVDLSSCLARQPIKKANDQ